MNSINAIKEDPTRDFTEVEPAGVCLPDYDPYSDLDIRTGDAEPIRELKEKNIGSRNIQRA